MHILQKNVVMVANTVARWYIYNALLGGTYIMHYSMSNYLLQPEHSF